MSDSQKTLEDIFKKYYYNKDYQKRWKKIAKEWLQQKLDDKCNCSRCIAVRWLLEELEK